MPKTHDEATQDLASFIQRRVPLVHLERYVGTDSTRNLKAGWLLNEFENDDEFIELMDPLITPCSRSRACQVRAVVEALVLIGREIGLIESPAFALEGAMA